MSKFEAFLNKENLSAAETVVSVVEQFADEQDFHVEIDQRDKEIDVYILGFKQPGSEDYLSATEEDAETFWANVLNRLEIADEKTAWRELVTGTVIHGGDLRITFTEDPAALGRAQALEKINFGHYESMFTEVLDKYLHEIDGKIHVAQNNDVFSFYPVLKRGIKQEMTSLDANEIKDHLIEKLLLAYPQYNWPEAVFVSESNGQHYINLDYQKVPKQ